MKSIQIYIFIAILLILSSVTIINAAGVPPSTEPRYIIDREGDYSKVTTSGGLVVVSTDYAHHENHDGNAYQITNSATLASGAASKIFINTPAASSGIVHLIYQTRASGEANVKLYEFTEVSDIGTPKIPVNKNRTSSNISATSISLAPTVTALGNLISEAHFGSGQAQGGESRGIHEFVLRPLTSYFLNTVSEAANNDTFTEMDWYEDSGDAP